MAIAKANELTPYYDAGEDVTGYVTSAVTGKRFVRISGNRQAGPALNTSTSGGNVSIAPATAAQRVFGVAKWDGAVGDLVAVRRTPGPVASPLSYPRTTTSRPTTLGSR